MYNSNILDPIHGLIKVSEIEKWIFGQKPFNRLRRVKQNTFLFLVFPSANHNRFEHSIGVMHLAHQIYINANENYLTGIYKKSKYDLQETKEFEFFSVSNNVQDFEDVLIQELRIAALLHDVGHGPMSHLFDHYTITGNSFLEILKNDSQLEPYIENFKKLIKDPYKRVEHEVVSCLFVIKIISRLKEIDKRFDTKFNPQQKNVIENLSINRIIQMIEPSFNLKSALIFEDLDYNDFFSSIISSFPLDADRMDYMARDSYFSGVNYGLYDKSRLMMSFIPIKYNNGISMAIKESGIDSIIRFIQSRTHLYNQVYFHKTNRAANTMLDFACEELKESNPIIEANTYEEFEDFYWSNSDELFLWNTLRSKVKGELKGQILEELLERNLVKRIFQKKITLYGKSPSEIKEIRTKLNELLSKFRTLAAEIEPEVVMVDNYPNVIFKDLDKSTIKIISKNGDNYTVESNWREFNDELKILEHEIIMFRIYLHGKFSDRKIFNDKKQKIVNEFSGLIKELSSFNSGNDH
jgi:HD superfamily phosphohydrolase